MSTVLYVNSDGKNVTHTSYSSRSTFKKCPREFQLTRIDGWSDKDLEEERRIFFVACSRAAKKLHVSANGVASDLIRHKLPTEGSGVIDPWEGFSLLQQ